VQEISSMVRRRLYLERDNVTRVKVAAGRVSLTRKACWLRLNVVSLWFGVAGSETELRRGVDGASGSSSMVE
jgi:hypothetical protein